MGIASQIIHKCFHLVDSWIIVQYLLLESIGTLIFELNSGEKYTYGCPHMEESYISTDRDWTLRASGPSNDETLHNGV